MKGDLVVTSVPVVPPPLKLNAIGGVATAGADVEDDDEPKVKGAAAGFTSGTVGGVLGAAPNENGEDVASGCFFSWPNENEPNRGFGASTTGGGTAVGELELVFADDPKENAGLAVSAELVVVDVAADPEPGK
jgi:hypothetical protein